MFLTLCKSKLHRATVTQAELHYEGSITIDTELLTAAGILPFERVQVVDIANGTRFETYAIEGRAGSRTVCVRSEEHTSELQSRSDLVCRLLLEKKKKQAHPMRLSRSH